MKKISPIVSVLVITSSVGLSVVATKSHAATISANSCSTADVSAAVKIAAVGDTITVPYGTCTWTSALSIDKGISLVGAGIGNTVINSTASWVLTYTPANKSINALFRVSGFTFDLGGGSRSGINLTSGNTTILQTKVRIDHNRFQNIAQGTSAYSFIRHSGIRGVIDNNYFTIAQFPVRANGNFDSGVSFWNNHEGIVFGAADNNLWFEDNVFNMGAGGQITDCIEGLRYGFRYNTINMPNGYQQMFDLHGDQGSSMYSCFGAEIYGNNITGSANGQFMDQRGGRAFIFNNNFPNSSWNLSVREEWDGSELPLNYVGPNGPQQPFHVSGTYHWGNRATLTGSIIATAVGSNCGVMGCYSGDRPKAGRDYFTVSSSPGVSCGTPANRPGTCVVGQGYWATNQSCTNLTGMVGVNPATPIAGTLYRCIATNTWDSGASLLRYPHPLREAASSQLSPPFLHDPTLQ